MSDSETFLLTWNKTWSDAVDDFTGRDPDDHFSFIRVYRQKATPDPAKACLWIVTIGGERVASGHDADGPEGTWSAVRAAENAWRKMARLGIGKLFLLNPNLGCKPESDGAGAGRHTARHRAAERLDPSQKDARDAGRIQLLADQGVLGSLKVFRGRRHACASVDLCEEYKGLGRFL